MKIIITMQIIMILLITRMIILMIKTMMMTVKLMMKRPWQADATEQAGDLRRWESETRFPFFSGPCTPELHHVVHGYLNFKEGMLIRGNI